MVRLWHAGLLVFLMVSPLYAQEMLVDHYAVSLGLMPWENIVTEYHGQDSSFSAYQYRMAKEMATMHGGGVKGDYHVLVVIKDKDSGQQVKNAEVKVVASDKNSGSEEKTLDRMEMEGFAGYGGYLGFNFEKPYTIRVLFSLPPDNKIREVEFSNKP